MLDRQLKEGVPVKGELDKAAVNQGEAMNGGQMIAEGGLPSRPGQGAGRGARRAERYGFLNLGRIPPATPVAPEVAKVFGLVLGSPEFQRR